MAKPQQWSTTEVAEYAGIKVSSFRRQRLRPGFAPEPDGYIGRSPWWWSSNAKSWAKKRRGRGRPVKQVA